MRKPGVGIGGRERPAGAGARRGQAKAPGGPVGSEFAQWGQFGSSAGGSRHRDGAGIPVGCKRASEVCTGKVASPHSEDAAKAVAASGLKPTFTPCVLLTTGLGVRHQLAKISNLPGAELGKAFLLPIALLAVADTGRRTTNPLNTTHHWWHRDLRDTCVPDAIRQEFSHQPL
jgi:hypothetical protein